MVQICVRSGQLPNLGANIQLGRLLLLRARLLSLLLVVLVVAGRVVLGMGQRLDDKIDKIQMTNFRYVSMCETEVFLVITVTSLALRVSPRFTYYLSLAQNT